MSSMAGKFLYMSHPHMRGKSFSKASVCLVCDVDVDDE